MSTHILNDIYNGTVNTISLTGYNSFKSVVIVSSWVLSPVKSLYYMIGVSHPETPATQGENSTTPHIKQFYSPALGAGSGNTTVITRYDLIDAAERKERERQEKKKRRQQRRKSSSETSE
ncbi:hypothetical protein RNJ44_00762 [Nakaseomyces bracarensis]|uniref:Uncharacterized protein n=1 Tax=Nakaseomyces bracarensis TaxID=273131 RepID=A0ABR4NS03_9SACH